MLKLNVGRTADRAWVALQGCDGQQTREYNSKYLQKKLQIIWREKNYHVERNRDRVQGYDGQQTREYNSKYLQKTYLFKSF